MARNPDAIVVGGGIVGCAVAHRLALDGLAVTLVERGEIGREASWAAGGILTPVHLAEYPTALAGLCAASQRLYPPLVAALRQVSAADPEYRVTGFLILVRDDEEERSTRSLEEWKLRNGQPAERLPREEALARQPGLGADVRGALLLPDIAQVRNNRMAVALAEAAQKRGVEIRRDTPVTGFLRVPGRVNGIKTARGDLYAGTTVLAAGAWSGEILRSIGLELAVRPIKGQILLAEAPPDLVRTTIQGGDVYLIPRADGKVLIGSTLEDAGFDKRVTLDAVGELAAKARRILPAMAGLPLLTSWAGLRPSTPDRLPYIGRAGMEGLIVATGHFRNGILLAPVTAELVSELLAGKSPSVPLEPFDPLRKASS